jgi:geranylgeranyl reductase family protein
MTAKSDFDVIVIGAGPAGSTAAYSLAKGGLKVGLLDKSDFPRDKTCGDGLTPRALKVLEQIGVLGAVGESAYAVHSLTLRFSETLTYDLSLSSLRGLPHSILIHPRLSLDDLLRQHAVRAGAEFLPEAKVDLVTRDADGTVCIDLHGRNAITCKLAIIATGANTKLLRDVGLLRQAPPINLAARCYFENVEGLERSIILFFDQVEMPGYGWIFPVTPTSANVGCGVFFDSQTPQVTQLRHLIETHPYLKRILRNAQQIGPIKGFPLRTDFSPNHCGNEFILVAGESAGLVNPVTGEGIDYALESGRLAATAILENWNGNGQASPRILKAYRAGLRKRFSYQMGFTHLTQRLLFGRHRLGHVIKRARHSRHLQRVILEACFDSADPAVVFSPRTIWDLLKP